MKFKFVVIFLISLLTVGYGQEFPKDYFRAPLDIPMYLSGNFGELRSNHYHSGLDIKTQGREGHKVYATADGFVSRVKVSPYGYGNAVYITHPNGYTTVYAHLKNFSKKIDEKVKALQYKKESFAIDEMLPANAILVRKGEVIALSGNSGSSGGPHLHYEIRETKSEFPVNPLLFGMAIKDNVKPVLRTLFIYDLNKNKRKSYPLQLQGENYQLKTKENPVASGFTGFGIDARDYMTGTRNYYGIYKLRLYVDAVLLHSFTFDKFSFFESRYINAHIDYPYYKKQKRRIHRLYHLPNQQESFTPFSTKGILFNDGKVHNIQIEIADAYGNTSSLKFEVQATFEAKQQDAVEKYYWKDKNEQSTDSFFVNIPQKAFYQDIEKQSVIAKKSERKDSYSPLYYFLDETVPLHKAITVGIKPKSLPQSLESKAFLAKESKGKYSFIGNDWQGEFLLGKTKSLGRFTVLVDTVSPKIEVWKGSSYKKTGKLRYKITDNLSGIESFRGEIDGNWVLFEYDPKKRTLWHQLSAKRIQRGTKHRLVLKVTDSCGNVSERRANFSW